jgi:chemotaxis protein MotB
MFRKITSQEEEKNIFWVSYTDFMLSLTAIFIVLMSFFLYQYQSVQAEKEKSTQKQSIEKQQQEGYKELKEEFENIIQKNPQIDAKVSDEGTVRFYSTRDKVLFPDNSDQITPYFEQQLNIFLPEFLMIAINKKDKIKEIRIEGHASKKGDYLYNLDLSNRRANKVLSYMLTIMQEKYESQFISYIQKHTLSCGFSYSKMLDAYGRNTEDEYLADEEKCRRVEFRILLKN